MSEILSFFEEVKEIRKQDKRYPLMAYVFLADALGVTSFRVGRRPEGTGRHVNARELLVGIRDLAISEFGLMAWAVFDNWNTRLSDDFGNMVYNMVDRDYWKKTDSDRKEDFDGVMDFKEIFSGLECEADWVEERVVSHNFFTDRGKQKC